MEMILRLNLNIGTRLLAAYVLPHSSPGHKNACSCLRESNTDAQYHGNKYWCGSTAHPTSVSSVGKHLPLSVLSRWHPLGLAACVRTCHSGAGATSDTVLQGKMDRYHGVHCDLQDEALTVAEFDQVIRASLKCWTSGGVTAAWLHIPIHRSHYISVASQYGFLFHHAEGSNCMLYQWLVPGKVSRLPQFATHQIGVAGCVLRDDTQQVLVVREKNKPLTLWKFPGGLSELGEDLGKTAEREVLEETGVQTEVQGLLAFRQQHSHPGAFGRSDLFFVCLMRPVTFALTPCSEEIELCQWMSLQDLQQEMAGISAFTQRIVDLVRLCIEQGPQHVLLTTQQFQSVYKGLWFNMYNRPLPSEQDKTQPYVHSVVDTVDKTSF